MNEFKIQFFRWVGIALGALALVTVAALLYKNWMVNFMQWPLVEQLAIGAAVVLLLAGSRLRYWGSRYEAQNSMRQEKMPDGKLNERLQIYENRARENPRKGVPAADFDVQLRKLHELKEAGILSEEEFQLKKDEILSRM